MENMHRGISGYILTIALEKTKAKQVNIWLKTV
jgi:hypothetical protein